MAQCCMDLISHCINAICVLSEFCFKSVTLLFIITGEDNYLSHFIAVMSKISSPTHFKGELDHFYDPTFTADISQKMQVPKSIRVSGDREIDDYQRHNSWLNEKFDMHVPDRILVVGKYRLTVTIILHSGLQSMFLLRQIFIYIFLQGKSSMWVLRRHQEKFYWKMQLCPLSQTSFVFRYVDFKRTILKYCIIPCIIITLFSHFFCFLYLFTDTSTSDHFR